jgi:amino acid adenylation domain-containing protein
LFRVHLFERGAQEYEMLLVMHHIITDGWSMGILVNHLADEYRRYAADADAADILNNTELQYGDYAEWQVERLESGKLSRQIDYWKEELKNTAGRLALPNDFVRPPEPTFDGDQIPLIIDPETSEKLNRIARTAGATLYMTLLAALKILLWRYSGEKDVAVGSPAANREIEETSELIGFFVNTLVIKSRITPEMPFLELLEQVKNKALKAFANQAVPFEKLVEIIQPDRDRNVVPLFQVMLILQNFPVRTIDLTDLEIAPLEAYSGKSKLDLVFNLREENNRILGNIEYAKELFKKETVERFARQFTTLLENLCATPGAVVSDLSLSSDDENRRLLEETALIDEFGGENLLHELFEKAAAEFPSEICIEYGGRHCNYESLDKKANRIAHALAGQISGKQPVGVMLAEPFDQIAAMLGVLKSGNHFFCLDAEHPAERLTRILDETTCACLITDAESLEKQSGLFTATENRPKKLIVLDTDEPQFAGCGEFFGKSMIASQPENAPLVTVAPDDLAYIVYTSGSTGKPKGIMQSHRSFSQFARWFGNEFGLAPKVKTAQWASVTYDAAYAEIFSALICGATLCPLDSKTKNDPRSAADWLFENSISVFQSVPAFFSRMASMVEKTKFSKLRYILLAGEILPVELAENWLRKFPAGPVLYNLYGPTETVLATFHRIEKIAPRTKSVSVGRAIAGRQILILDHQKRLCPYGVPGEIYIRSPYLTSGYFQRREETERRFIANPLTGEANDRVFRTGDRARWTNKENIEFFGRLDSQVKIRGNRIEIEEIETALRMLPSINDGAIVAAKDAEGQSQLTAFVVSDEAIPAHLIRKQLSETLPVYMLPSAILFVEKIPLTPSGKPDRIALLSQIPEMPEALRQEYCAPETPLEENLAGMWQELLEIEKIGVNDDFFQLGGHSLLAAQIVNRIRREYETEISLRSFLMNPTIKQLAENIAFSKQFAGYDPQRLAALIEKVKRISDDEVLTMTQSLLAANNIKTQTGAPQ